MKDDDGYDVVPGDWISFSYGIPPVGVQARVSTEHGELIATVLGRHRPRTVKLASLRSYVGNWYKVNGPGQSEERAPPMTPTPQDRRKR